MLACSGECSLRGKLPRAETVKVLPTEGTTILTIGRVINPNGRRKVTEQERSQIINKTLPEYIDIIRRRERLPRGYLVNLSERLDLSKNAAVNRLKKAARMSADVQPRDFKRGRPTLLSEAEEEAVVKCLLELDLSHRGLSVQKATGLINGYLRLHGTRKAVTRKLVRGILKRHSDRLTVERVPKHRCSIRKAQIEEKRPSSVSMSSIQQAPFNSVSPASEKTLLREKVSTLEDTVNKMSERCKSLEKEITVLRASLDLSVISSESQPGERKRRRDVYAEIFPISRNLSDPKVYNILERRERYGNNAPRIRERPHLKSVDVGLQVYEPSIDDDDVPLASSFLRR